MKKKFLFIIVIISLSLLLAACSDDEDNAQNSENDTQQTAEESSSSDNTELERVAEDEVVATVNGEEIMGSKYNTMYNQTLMMFNQSGQDGTNADLVQEQTLSSLIEQELLRQETEELGIEAPNSQVDERFEQIKSQFKSEDQFQTQLTELEMTEESLRNQLAYEIKLNQYIEQEVPEVEVTDEEVKSYYDQLVSQQGEGEAPALEEVEQQIRNQIANQKQQSKLASVIEILKEESEIEKLI
ncbi:SurA N-terminal domain-containing protein [Aquibacillus rhizosphaerae]|uniref:peptidylprolyl isomerase n=1 Tax=Aquibacillus rhizosphaerae TaxID=3051431 RepID=A0ABT7L7J0_9BACI|nr:SurA N-terminal domain-containing protein [Aquibacillus sp. LR5S19]MDL4840565.1 SurA N-terminal domain-containing protein [Aquibacillus sp. LR5S19]